MCPFGPGPTHFYLVTLNDLDSLKHNFGVCHFYHGASVRTKHWETLHAVSHLIPRDTISLSDHNSVVVPTHDILCPRNSLEMFNVSLAGNKEVHFITEQGLVDAFVWIHEGTMGKLRSQG